MTTRYVYTSMLCDLYGQRKKDMVIMKHNTHIHSLKLRDLTSNQFCALCKENIEASSPAPYCCSNCNYYLHKLCAELPMCLKIPYHHHFLFLEQLREFDCSACLVKGEYLAFRCKECNLYLDVKCAGKRPIIEEGDETLHHFAHLHPLAFCNLENNQDQICCRVCGLRCQGPTYCCIDCQFYLHHVCARQEVPKKIQHYFHTCDLTLTSILKDFCCKACGLSKEKVSHYECFRCKFKMDIRCALLQNHNQNQVKHFSHLQLQNLFNNDEIKNCSACRLECGSGDHYYACVANDTLGCKFFLHRSCFDQLSQGLHISLHPAHPMMITSGANECNACLGVLRGLSYSCEVCNFELHSKCCAMSNIEYEDHNHPLILLLNEGNQMETSHKVYCVYCTKECNLPIFRCMQCVYETDYTLHLGCGPLPMTIKHKSHSCCPSLTLTAPGKDYKSDNETQESYCDVCEDVRKDCFPTYDCKECNFRVEIKCVYPKVIDILRGEGVDKNLISLVANRTGTVLADQDAQTLREIVNSLTENQENRLNEICNNRANEVPRKRFLFGYDTDYELCFSSPQQAEFHENLRYGIPEYVIKFWVPDEAVIRVQEYNVTQSLAPILKKLCAKYKNDFPYDSSRPPLDPNLRKYFIVMFCGTVYSISNTKLKDVTENTLRNWWCCYDALFEAGFNVSIFNRQLEKSTKFCIGYHIKKIKDKLDQDIKNVENNINNLSRGIAESQTDLMHIREILASL